MNMPKFATKAAGNVFYEARREAASLNERLGSRDGAAEEAGIDKTRLTKIELGSTDPYPEEVLLMMGTYKAPELGNYYCSQVCRLGKLTVPQAEMCELDRLAIKAIAALGDAEKIKSTIIEIVADGKVTKEEQPKLEYVLKSLEQISRAAAEAKIWVEKNLR